MCQRVAAPGTDQLKQGELMQEVWLPVRGYENSHEVSNLGQVRSARTVLRQRMGNGYWMVDLKINGTRKTQTVHALVASAFLGPRPTGLQVRHGRKGRLCNAATNLSYGTPSENNLDKRRDGTDNRGGKHNMVKLTDSEVLLIRELRKEGSTLRAIGNEFGVSESLVSLICARKRWAHL